MRTKSLALSFGTALVLTASSVSVWALGSTTQIAKPPSTSGGSTTVGKDVNPSTNDQGGNTNSQTNNLYPGGGSSGSSNSGGLGGGPSTAIAKLQGKPLNVCENRQNSINNILNRIETRSTNQSTFFGNIATKVETFVTSKNLTVPNYASLVANIKTDQSTVTQDITELKANDTISCTGLNPSGTASAFKTDLKQTVTDLQTYHNDVKNLIDAVKAIASNSSQTNPSGAAGGNQ